MGKATGIKRADVGRAEFGETAEPLVVSMNGTELSEPLEIKEFSSGSYGWYGAQKTTINVNGTAVKCQISTCVTVLNSKLEE